MRDGKGPAGTSHPGRTPVAGDAPCIVPRIRPGPQDILEKLPDPAAAGGEEGGLDWALLHPPPRMLGFTSSSLQENSCVDDAEVARTSSNLE